MRGCIWIYCSLLDLLYGSLECMRNKIQKQNRKQNLKVFVIQNLTKQNKTKQMKLKLNCLFIVFDVSQVGWYFVYMNKQYLPPFLC